MSRSLSLRYHFPATPEQLFAFMRDRNFLVRRLSVLQMSSAELVEYQFTSDSVKTTVKTSVPRTLIPHAVRGFVPAEPGFWRTEQWHTVGDLFKGAMTVKLNGIPADVRGTMSLQRSDGGSLLLFDCTIRVPIPVLGILVENALFEQITEIANAEAAFLEDHILNAGQPDGAA